MSITINERFSAKLSSLLEAGLDGRAYEEPETSTGYLTKGDYANEIASVIDFGTRGGHIIRAFDKISPDILLCYQSKMVGFNLMVGSDEELRPVGRSVKRTILGDAHLAVVR